MSSREYLRALRLQIGNNRFTSKVSSTSSRFFIPPSVLDTIFTPSAIAHAVAELDCPPEDRINLARAIETHGRITFAILVWMKCEDSIVDFRRASCLDSRLPLDGSTATRIIPEYGREFAAEYQWEFLPHFFHRDDDLDIDPSVVLPIVRQVGEQVGGGFGVITKIEIHPLLQDFSLRPDRSLVIVRKTLRAEGTENHRKMLFKKEKSSLRLLNCLRHPNIIPFFGAYTYGEEFNFLFPFIDMDLAAFFRRTSRYGDFRWDITFFSALHGLASALKNAHNVHLRTDTEGIDYSGIGYHHDLRPANILVSKETFILADFGMGGLKPEAEGSRTDWKAGSGDYLAPECMDANFIHQDVGRSIDVWAFGCLMADVATYIKMGAGGLTKFSEVRLSPGSFSNWATSYFHDDRGNLKGSVKQWLDSLSSSNLHALDTPFRSLILDILTPTSKRPPIVEICPRLAILSIKAHFFAALESLTKALEANSSTIPDAVGSMKIWFERERLRAFGNVLCLYSTSWDSSIPEFVEQESKTCVKIMIQLFKMFQPPQAIVGFSTGGADEPSVDDNQAYSLPNTMTALERKTPQFQTDQEAEVQRLIQELWDILPKAQLKKVESIWVNSMLETDDISQLDQLEQNLNTEQLLTYQEGAAMAMMKRIRLEMIQNPTSSSELKEMELAATDVIETRDYCGHKIGIYKSNATVIIEWMYYYGGWENVPSSERTTVMSLKAKGFSIDHKSQSLRLLHCLGFFEQPEGRRQGYGFVYQVPQRESTIDPAHVQVTTLQQLLILSVKNSRTERHLNQPLLGDKYHLAYQLAAFLMEFHRIGWLHENFHSNNMIFFDEPPDGQSISPAYSRIITEPYVVGLHKSRPGGDAWHTQGPVQEADFLDYEHPAYATTKRFRNGYDYYSLGVVLLEIGLWTPLKVWSGKSEHRTMNPHAFRNALVETYVPRLGPRMGMVYQNIVRLLLADGLDPLPEEKVPNPKREHDAFSRFFDEVVGPLAELCDVDL